MNKVKFVARISTTNTKKYRKKEIIIPESEWDNIKFEKPVLVTLEEII